MFGFILWALFPDVALSQTIQAEIPDSVIKKYHCQTVWKLVDAARNQFKEIRGTRRNLKYSVIYQSTLVLPGSSRAEIAYEGTLCQYTAKGVNTTDGVTAAKSYAALVSLLEHCLEGWVFETEVEENSDQLYRFRAHEKEDMMSGILAEVTLTKNKGVYQVMITIQP